MREIVAGQGFDSGKTIEILAQELNVRESRVLDYPLSYLQDGHPFRAEGIVPNISLSGQDLERAMEAFRTLGPEMLSFSAAEIVNQSTFLGATVSFRQA